MKFILFVSSLFIVLSVSVLQGQNFEKIIVDPHLDHPLFNSADSILNPLTRKGKAGYDGLPDSNFYEIQSTILINQDTLKRIRFASARKVSKDTVEITLHETSPLYHHNLTVEIVNNKFNISYRYDMPGPSMEREIKTISQKLTLRNADFENQEKILGKIQFKGSCIQGCRDTDITIEGYFKAVIK